MFKNTIFDDAIICSRAEIISAIDKGCTHIVSIINSDSMEVSFPDQSLIHTLLTLRLDDVLVDQPDGPNETCVEQILAFGQNAQDALSRGEKPRLGIHCLMGVSRSSAAMTVLLAQHFTQASGEEIFDLLLQIRPQAWPNSMLVAMTDKKLNRNGDLLAALPALYARQLAAYPHYKAEMLHHNRHKELEMAQLAAS